jgi:uncharacterized protein
VNASSFLSLRDLGDAELDIASSAPDSVLVSLAQHHSTDIGVILEVSSGAGLCLLTNGGQGDIGAYVKINVRDRWIVGAIRSVHARRVDTSLALNADTPMVADIEFIGEGFAAPDGKGLHSFKRGITRFPGTGDILELAEPLDLAAVFSGHGQGNAFIELGTVYPTESVRSAVFVDPLLSKHFALVGSTGTGKSCTTALLLRRIVEVASHGHVILLDPHGEYGAAFQDIGHVLNTQSLELPYWLMNFEEHIEVFIGKNTENREAEIEILSRCLAQARAKSRVAASLGRVTVDTPVPYLLSDLQQILQAAMGKLDKPDTMAPYLRLKHKLEELRGDPRYSFMFSGMLVSDVMANVIGTLFRLPTNGKPISIIDLSGVPSDIVNVVVAVLSRLVFDFALWSRNEGEARPILLICEEAHRYVPAERFNTQNAARRMLERIAKEGRKYGVSLGLISQRPSDLSESVLSQCGTFIAMRLNNERDHAFVRNALPEGSRAFLDALPVLRNRECIICGEGVAVPTRVRIDDLDTASRPASDDPIFSQRWAAAGQEAELIDSTIRRWRSQGR